ncbi:MAG TPA: gephyrin-like molybdotransferase Glp [Polyangiaceae bacterium]|jgi:molybdopterin molybdotransferase
MLEFDEALAMILRAAPTLARESVTLDEALGRVLAEDLSAPSALPAFDYSAMDGYAVDIVEFDAGERVELPVRGESRAGADVPRLLAGSACRVFTGAPIPLGANAVVMQENVAREDDRALFSSKPRAGDHIRRAGEDLERGALGLAAGTRLGPFQVGLAAALDRDRVTVSQRPRVTILCTGDELRAPGTVGSAASIPDCNGPALRALARIAGAEARILGHTIDTLEATRAAIERALIDCDLLLTVGGVSVGEHDLVRVALEAVGVGLQFWKVRIKPGKPLVFGRKGSTCVLGLPGNPVSAQITFALFGVPLVRKMLGDRQVVPRRDRARLASALHQKPGRLGFYRARLEGDVAHIASNQASGSPVSLACADALVLVPADSEGYEAGASVEFIRLSEL